MVLRTETAQFILARCGPEPLNERQPSRLVEAPYSINIDGTYTRLRSNRRAHSWPLYHPFFFHNELSHPNPHDKPAIEADTMFSTKGFDPVKDLPDLKGKVALVTGGK